ncbi:MAG: hypothetical protein ACXW05_20560 [Gemmatirosa sp.]
MIASALLYLGVLVALLGLVAFVLWRRLRGGRGRAWGPLAVVTGAGLALLGLFLPVRDTVVTRPRTRLDTILPRYQFHERHAIAIAATPLDVDRAIREVTADEIRFYRTLTWIRRGGRRGSESILHAPRGVPILVLASRTGFDLLADPPAREIVFGVAGPVSPSARAAARVRAQRPFVASAEGHASIAMDFTITPDGRGGALLSTETRVFAPDAATRRQFAKYWRVIYPGSALIRRGWLAAIRRRAEGAP